MPRYWLIAPVESNPAEQFAKVWQFDLANGLISIGWEAVGDISKMNREALYTSLAEAYPDKRPATKALIANMLWAFWNEIHPGDLVIARRGRKILAAVGKVVRAGFYEPGRNPFLDSPSYSHHGFIGVEWQELPRNKTFPDVVFPMQTLREISETEYLGFVEADPTLVSAPLTSESTGLVEAASESALKKYEAESAFVLEKYLEHFIVTNFHTIFKGDLQMYQDGAGADGQQYDTEIGRIDILAIEPKSNSFVVIELKKGNGSDQVVGQILRYMGWVKKELCKDGQAVRGLIICENSDQKLTYALAMTNAVDVRYYSVSFKLSETPPGATVI